MALLQEFVTVMKPISAAVAVLRKDTSVFKGILLPTVTIVLQKLEIILQKSDLQYCNPLVTALVDGMNSRFQYQLEDFDNMLASAFHPLFKLSWLQHDKTKRIIKEKMTRLLTDMENIVKEQNVISRDENEEETDFFASLQERSNFWDCDLARQVDAFLDLPLAKSALSPNSFPSKAFLELFIKYNTAIPSCSAVNGAFTLGNDFIQHKHSDIGDQLLEMLVFLKVLE